ncbi:MAG: hypothetical protein KY453_11170, partial [Gemmatimonadetes bacterium]|nr:hypothetical protein [Gemmatimonadota bacterium]
MRIRVLFPALLLAVAAAPATGEAQSSTTFAASLGYGDLFGAVGLGLAHQSWDGGSATAFGVSVTSGRSGASAHGIYSEAGRYDRHWDGGRYDDWGYDDRGRYSSSDRCWDLAWDRYWDRGYRSYGWAGW